MRISGAKPGGFLFVKGGERGKTTTDLHRFTQIYNIFDISQRFVDRFSIEYE
jgi:hypothetical protein